MINPFFRWFGHLRGVDFSSESNRLKPVLRGADFCLRSNGLKPKLD